jgi:hypothetical protein
MSSQESRRDCDNFRIDGVRDLIDFFPVALDIKTLLGIFQPNVYEYRLKAATENLKVVFPELTTETVENYLVDVETARTVALKQTFPVPQDKWPISGAYNIAARQGLSAMLATASTQDAPSVVLLEGVKSGQASLVLEVFDPSGNKVFSNSLNLSLDGVEQMFRHKNLIQFALPDLSPQPPETGTEWGELDRLDVPLNCPDKECLDVLDEDFIFVHGYNVDGQQARGWQSEMFKRLFRSGLRSRFWGVTWYGSKTQQLNMFTINFRINARNALHTAPDFRNFLNDNMQGKISIASHSLGNMLTASALLDPGEALTVSIGNVFMIDTAVALEAFTGEIEGGGDPDCPGGPRCPGTDVIYAGEDASSVSSAANPMINPKWYDYEKKLGSSEWYKHFDAELSIGGKPDARRSLTLRGRYADLNKIGATFYNFYSSGEEVLGTHYGDLAAFEDGSEFVVDGGRNAWTLQEKLKGRMWFGLGSSNYGGWSFASPYVVVTSTGTISYLNNAMPLAIANQLTPTQLRTQPFFGLGQASPLSEPGGSEWAEIHRDQLLAEAIPSITLPSGGPGGKDMDIKLFDKNVFDMQDTFTSGWPQVRIDKGDTRWKHSDLRNVAYLYVYKIFKKMANSMGVTQ